ncbi:MAG: hypothetical protein HY299_14895 [Verrucomicrobia bacterium]|nr:hypothetical protein [Verrucomicrobiota bacterium]
MKQLVYHLTRRDDLRDSLTFYFNPKVLAYYDSEKSREFHEWQRAPPGYMGGKFSGRLADWPRCGLRESFGRVATGFCENESRADRRHSKRSRILEATEGNGAAARQVTGTKGRGAS